MEDSELHPEDAVRIGTARVLFIFAWVIEIIAVLTGIAITIMVGIDTYNKNLAITGIGKGVTNYTNVAIASLPFLMVSIVELAKIPTAQAFYVTVNKFWKILFAAVLAFLALITFETALNGFERNFTNLNYQVSASRERLDAVNGEVVFLQTQIEEAKTLTRSQIITDFERQNAIFVKNREASMGALNTAMSRARTAKDNTQIKALETQRADLKEDRKREIDQRQDEIETVTSSWKRKEEQIKEDDELRRKTLIDERQQLEDRLRNLDTAMQAEVRGAFLKQRVRERYAPELEKLKRQIDQINGRLRSVSLAEKRNEGLKNYLRQKDQINSKYDTRMKEIDQRIAALDKNISERAGFTQSDLDRERKRFDEERKRIEATYTKNRDEIIKHRDQRLTTLQEKEAKIAGNEARIATLQEQIAVLRNDINQRANDNQIYRIAMMFDGNANTAADVSSAAVNMVGKIWFGSLAMVIATTGILLALASEVVRDPGQVKGQPKTQKSGLRSLSLAINRWQRRRPKIQIKEVVREVPVNKVVLQDGVKEVVKKEVIHVPIYTSDPDLVKRQND